jgi:hypothetical protein
MSKLKTYKESKGLRKKLDKAIKKDVNVKSTYNLILRLCE